MHSNGEHRKWARLSRGLLRFVRRREETLPPCRIGRCQHDDHASDDTNAVAYDGTLDIPRLIRTRNTVYIAFRARVAGSQERINRVAQDLAARQRVELHSRERDMRLTEESLGGLVGIVDRAVDAYHQHGLIDGFDQTLCQRSKLDYLLHLEPVTALEQALETLHTRSAELRGAVGQFRY